MTPAIRDDLGAHKKVLLEVLWRVDEMRRLAQSAPRAVAYARESATGGAGHCFSCGDDLGAPDVSGRCVPCGLAADTYYAMLETSGNGAMEVA